VVCLLTCYPGGVRLCYIPGWCPSVLHTRVVGLLLGYTRVVGLLLGYTRVGYPRVYIPGWVIPVCTYPGGIPPSLGETRVGYLRLWEKHGCYSRSRKCKTGVIPVLGGVKRCYFRPVSERFRPETRAFPSGFYSLGCLRFIPIFPPLFTVLARMSSLGGQGPGFGTGIMVVGRHIPAQKPQLYAQNPTKSP